MSWVYCEPKSMIRMPSWCWGTRGSLLVSLVTSSRGSEATEGPCQRIPGDSRRHPLRAIQLVEPLARPRYPPAPLVDDHLRGPRAGVVVRGHHESVGPGAEY